MLKRGSSVEVVGYNVRELIKSGMDHKSAVATALAHKRRHQQEETEEGPVVDAGALDDGRRGSMARRRMQGLSDGGEVEDPSDGASSSRGASTGGVGSGLGGAGTGGAATGGASTGGAGTVNVTIGGGGSKKQKGKGKGEPNNINISGVGGTTDAGNVGSGDGPGASGRGGGPDYPKGEEEDMGDDPQRFAFGGEVSSDLDAGISTFNDEESERSIGQMRDQGVHNPGVMNPGHQDHDRLLARALYKKGEDEEMMKYYTGGLVKSKNVEGSVDQDDSPRDEPFGNIPTSDMSGGPEAPMTDEDEASELTHELINGVPILDPSPLTKETLAAIMRNKNNRKRRNMG